MSKGFDKEFSTFFELMRKDKETQAKKQKERETNKPSAVRIVIRGL